MGHITRYELVIDGPEPYTDYSHIIEHLRDTNEQAAYALNEDGNTLNSCKWYTRDEDLKRFSKLYPWVVFHLHGEGDGDFPDAWNAYFKDGKSQVCPAIVTYEPCKFTPTDPPDAEKDPVKAYETLHGPLSKLPEHVAELVKKGLLSD